MRLVVTRHRLHSVQAVLNGPSSVASYFMVSPRKSLAGCTQTEQYEHADDRSQKSSCGILRCHHRHAYDTHSCIFCRANSFRSSCFQLLTNERGYVRLYKPPVLYCVTSNSAAVMRSTSAPESVRCCRGSKNPIAEATATAVSSASPVIMHTRVEHACRATHGNNVTRNIR